MDKMRKIWRDKGMKDIEARENEQKKGGKRGENRRER